MTSAGVTPDDEIRELRDREADDAWKDYLRSGRFASNAAVMAWLDTWGTDREDSCPALEEGRA